MNITYPYYCILYGYFVIVNNIKYNPSLVIQGLIEFGDDYTTFLRLATNLLYQHVMYAVLNGTQLLEWHYDDYNEEDQSFSLVVKLCILKDSCD